MDDTIPKERNMRWSRNMHSTQSIYDSDFKIEDLDGDSLDLSQFKGHPLLIVNVATFCTYADQYRDFGPLLERNKDLRILGFPCNQFGLQEPCNNEEILNAIRYVRPGNNFTLPEGMQLAGKIEVNGQNEHPLYTMLKSTCPATVRDIGSRDLHFHTPIRVNDICWNFEKFLIDPEGVPRFRFHTTAWDHGNLLAEFLHEVRTGEKVQLQNGACCTELPNIIDSGIQKQDAFVIRAR